MKKLYIPLILILSIFVFTGCEEQPTVSIPGIDEEISIDVSQTPPPEASEDLANIDVEIDLDLTSLSSTMFQAQAQRIQNEPLEFLGQVIKMSGVYFSTPEAPDMHFIIISDETGCCLIPFEFAPINENFSMNNEEPLLIVAELVIYNEQRVRFQQVA